MTGLSILTATQLVRRIGDAEILHPTSLELRRGEAVALVGPSGCGKTTLLHLLGLLDQPTSGQLVIEGTEPWSGSARDRAALRLRHIGFVFQQSNLLPFLTARENVALPAWRASGSRRAALARADALLERFGLGARAGARGAVLSLGEAQRVATARALVNQPTLILADEPTGSLDSASTRAVLGALAEVCGHGTTLVVATHDPDVASRMSRVLRMRDGRLDDQHPAASAAL